MLDLKNKYLISLQTKYSNQIVGPTKQVLVSKSKVKENKVLTRKFANEYCDII